MLPRNHRRTDGLAQLQHGLRIDWQGFSKYATERGRTKKIRVAALVRCGELCKSCGDRCNELYTDGSFSEVECVACNGTGGYGQGDCDKCEGTGVFRLGECPKKMIGQPLVMAINMAGFAMRAQWPIEGGLFSQSAWFFDLVQTLESETNKIEAERMERA